MPEPALLPPTFEPLSLGSVRPLGWLLDQLRIQAAGLTGHLDEFWPDVMDSGWIGGSAEGWERGPYWLDGLVPLAFLLDDKHLIAKADHWIDYIVGHQLDDGWLGPEKSGSYADHDPWPTFVAFKAMTQYQETTGDERIIPTLLRASSRISKLLKEKVLSSWGQFRWADLVVSLHWLYERTGEPWLLDLATVANTQGYDWRGHFESFRYPEKLTRENTSLETHVVNNAMALRAPAIWWRQSRDSGDRDAVHNMIRTLDAYHGQVTGLFGGDEHYAGRSPSQGTELCAVVEYMYSLEILASLIGNVSLTDRLERIAFNALPGTCSADMWAHQYDQQANQVTCAVTDDPIWTTNGPASNIFGLEPNYGCCTANMHQGWPKFAAHQWMRSADNGLACLTWAPASVATKIGETNVELEVHTGYPFSEEIEISIRSDAPGRFPLHLRIPSWAQGATVTADATTEHPIAGEFHTIDRSWGTSSSIKVKLPMQLEVERRFNDSVSLSRGPIVYSLAVGEEWRKIGGEEPHADYEIHPTTPWNYALELDDTSSETASHVPPDTAPGSLRFEQLRDLSTGVPSDGGAKPADPGVFSVGGAPSRVLARGRRLPAWEIHRNVADPPPLSPVAGDPPVEDVVLLPYGCTRLRVTEMPVAEP